MTDDVSSPRSRGGIDREVPGNDAALVEVSAFLAAQPDIETIQLAITDACGVARGKNIAREELESLYTDGRNVAGSILGLDITGEDV